MDSILVKEILTPGLLQKLVDFGFKKKGIAFMIGCSENQITYIARSNRINFAEPCKKAAIPEDDYKHRQGISSEGLSKAFGSWKAA